MDIEKSNNIFLSIITPTYNRADYLNNCYKSLCSQTCKDFEWIVIDDGSTDNTREAAESFSGNNSDFSIEYRYKENGGKHTALNYAMKFVNGEIILILDSDDYLLPDAVAEVIKYWKKYRDDKTICGLSFLRGKDQSVPLAEFPNEIERSDHISFRINKGIGGDCCEVIRSDVMKEFPFPEFSGERFLGENYLWINIALKYDTIYIRKIIYICEYLEGGLSKSGRPLRMKNPRGGMITSKLGMDKRICLKERVKNAILYSCYGKKAGMKFYDIVKTSNHPILVSCFYPLGIFFFKKWGKLK